MSGGIFHYTPGDEVDVEVVEDGSGNLPDRGDFVKPTGETANHVQVSGLDADGDLAVAQMLDIPTDQDGNPTTGGATAVVVKPITWVPVSASFADADQTVGTEVQEYADGVVDMATAETDGNDLRVPAGVVFQTVAREFGIGDKIAIARYR